MGCAGHHGCSLGESLAQNSHQVRPSTSLKNRFGRFHSGVPTESAPDLIRRSLIAAGLTASIAVHQAILAHANVHHGLAETAEFLAIARSFGLIALRTAISGGAGSGAHMSNVACIGCPSKMTLVIPPVTFFRIARFLPGPIIPSNDLPKSAGRRRGSRPDRGCERQWCGI